MPVFDFSDTYWKIDLDWKQRKEIIKIFIVSSIFYCLTKEKLALSDCCEFIYINRQIFGFIESSCSWSWVSELIFYCWKNNAFFFPGNPYGSTFQENFKFVEICPESAKLNVKLQIKAELDSFLHFLLVGAHNILLLFFFHCNIALKPKRSEVVHEGLGPDSA